MAGPRPGRIPQEAKSLSEPYKRLGNSLEGVVPEPWSW